MEVLRQAEAAAGVGDGRGSGGELPVSGLVAVVSTDPRERVSDDSLDRLVRAYADVRGSETSSKAGGPRARAALLAQPGVEPPALIGASGAWCAVVGRPYSPASPLDSRLRDVDGQFALVSYDGRTDETRIATDPFGMQALYVAVRGSMLYVSTSALALARFLRARPNRFAVEIFLRAGYHFGALTNWEEIERIEPGTCLIVARGRVERDVYWRPAVDGSVAGLGLRETVDHCVTLAVSEVGRRYAGRGTVWIDMTGGFDSRLLALLLERARVEFECNTRGSSDDDDRAISAEIAQAKNWSLFDPAIPEDWDKLLPDLLPEALAWGDSHLEVLELAWVLAVHRCLGERHAALLAGGGGEHWRAAAWKQEFLKAGRTTTVNMRNLIDMRMLFPLDLSVLARDPTPEIRDDFRARMLAWASPYSNERNTIQLDVMWAYKMTGHFGAYMSADAGYLVPELPFYLKPLFEAAISADHRFRASHRLQRHAIARLDPELASVRTTAGSPAGPWQPRAVPRYAPYYAKIARRVVTKLTQVTLGRPLLALRDEGWWFPQSAWSAVVGVLGRDARDRREQMRSLSLYDPGALEALLERGFASAQDAQLLGRIVTVELALRTVDADLD